MDKFFLDHALNGARVGATGEVFQEGGQVEHEGGLAGAGFGPEAAAAGDHASVGRGVGEFHTAGEEGGVAAELTIEDFERLDGVAHPAGFVGWRELGIVGDFLEGLGALALPGGVIEQAGNTFCRFRNIFVTCWE